MCGRFAFTPDHHFAIHYRLKSAPKQLTSQFNIAPGSLIPVIIQDPKGNNILQFIRWGIVLNTQTSVKPILLFNIRSETITQKSSFRTMFATSRCLIPLSGFYEWQKQGSEKIPFYISLQKQATFSVAGVYTKDQKGILSCSIITTQSNTLIAPIHTRMPVILQEEDEDTYLNPDTPISALTSMLTVYNPQEMQLYQVSSQVNNAHVDTPELTQPLATLL